MNSRSFWDKVLHLLIPNPPWFQFWRFKRLQRLRRHLAGMILLILSLTFISLWLVAVQLTLHFTYRAQSPKTVPLLIELELDPSAKTLTLKRASRLAAEPVPAKTNPKPGHTLTQKSKNGQVVSTQNVLVLDTLMGENFDTLIDDRPIDNDPVVRPAKPKIITTLAYYPDSSLVLNDAAQTEYRLGNPELLNQAVQQTPLNSSPKNLDSASPAQPNAPHLNLAFVSNGYSDSHQFKQDATEMYSYLLTLAPFSGYSASIKRHFIFNQTNLNCQRAPSMPRLLVCDTYQLFQALGDKRYDSYIVIDNSNDYGGGAYLGSNIAFTYRDVTTLAKEVMAHEFGHSFGGLMDEYSYGTSYWGYPWWPNCDYSPCPKWNSRTDSGCYATCGYTNLYRSAPNTIMRSFFPKNNLSYGPVSIDHINQLMQPYLLMSP